MTLRSCILLLLLYRPFGAAAQQDPVVYSFYFTGDTGTDTFPSAAVQLLAFESFDDSLSTILLLGGNVLPEGMKGKNEKSGRAKKVLSAQLELFPAYRGRFYILPGEHDWAGGKPSGMEAVFQQQAFVDGWFRENGIPQNKTEGVFFPDAGLPGPVSYEVHPGIRLILLDSQWWLQGGWLNRVKKLPGHSRKQTRRTALQRLDSLLSLSAGKEELVLVVAHHPLISNGRRARHWQPFRFLINCTPLAVVKWFGLNRRMRQDLPQFRYRRYRKSVEPVLQKHPALIYVSAHERNMQYMIRNGVHHVISGSGSSLSNISRYVHPARFMDDLQTGFFRITVHASGSVMLHAYGSKDRGAYWKTRMLTLPLKTE